MKTHTPPRRDQGLTLVEILVIIVILSCIVYVMWPRPMAEARARAVRIQCINNLKQVGLAFRVLENDHGGNFPMAVSETNGGSMEYITGLSEFHHFQVMSNQLSAPQVLICPSEFEANRRPAMNFAAFGNANLSYFVGIVSNGHNPSLILSGDRNVTNGTSIKNGILTLTTNEPAGWTSKFHNKVGNILLADGSVQQDSISGLQNQIAFTGVETNCVQMPLIGP